MNFEAKCLKNTKYSCQNIEKYENFINFILSLVYIFYVCIIRQCILERKGWVKMVKFSLLLILFLLLWKSEFKIHPKIENLME